MQPPQDGGTGNAVASHPRYQYTHADLQILHEIISLATAIPRISSKNSFRAIYRAYDVVLAARKINPAFDSVYFRFILQLQAIPGKNIYDRFKDLLSKQGIDVADISFLETPAVAATDFTRQRYYSARQRRDRSSHGTTDVSSDDYHAENERARATLTRFRPTRRSLGGIVSSPTHEAIIAAELAARTRREEVRTRRDRSKAPTSENEDEVEEISRPRVPEDAADTLYNLRMKTVLREYFRHWHTMTVKRVVRHQWLTQIAITYDAGTLLRQAFDTWQEQRWFAVVERRAGRRYNTILVAKAWSVWIQRTATIVQRTQEVRQRILVRKYFNAWRAVVIENEEKIRLFQLSNALYKWRNSAKKKRRITAVAQRIYHENLVHRAYWTWFFQLCGILGMRRYNRTLREQHFDTWVEKTEKTIQMNRMAAAFYRRHTLQTIFNRWSERTLTCLDATDIATDHVEWKLTEHAFNSWRRQAKFAPLIAVMVEYVNDRVMSDHLTPWRRRTQQSLSAASIARQKLLKSGFKFWRLRLRSKIVSEQYHDKLEVSTLHNWILQMRYRQFKAWKDTNLARGVLVHWFNHRYTLMHNLKLIGTEVVVRNNTRLARSVLAFMKGNLGFRSQMVNDAVAFRSQGLLTRTLARWRLKADLCRMYEDWVEDAIYYFTVRRAMRQWKHSFKNSQRNRLRMAFHTVVRRSKRSLAAFVLDHWASRYDHLRHFTDTAEEFVQRRSRAVATGQLVIWRSRTQFLDEAYGIAEDYNNTRLLRYGLEIWRNKLTLLDEMNQHADVLYELQNASLATKHFQKWEAAYWRFDILRQTASKFERRRNMSQFRIFRNWKNAAKEKVEQRLFFEQRGIDNTIDEEFGPQWVPPDAPGQDLGKSMFGQSIRGQSSLRQSLGRSVLGRSIGVSGGSTTPAQTPSWRTVGRNRAFSRTPAGLPSFGSQSSARVGERLLETPRNRNTVLQTPINRGGTPASPLSRFSNRRGGFRGLPAMDESVNE